MDGYKNIGQASNGSSSGELKPETSKINFVVPSSSVLRGEIWKTEIPCSKPGILNDMIDLADKAKSQ